MHTGRDVAIRRLRHILMINAGFSLGSGLLLAIAARPLAAAMLPGMPAAGGIPVWAMLMAVGLAVMLGGLDFLRVARQEPFSIAAGWRICVGDELWVVGSVALLVLAGGELSALGIELVLAVAAVVGLFATLQFRALRRLGGQGAAQPAARP